MRQDAVILLVKPNCHLCEDARAVVREVTAEFGMGFSEQSIAEDAELTAKYADEVPVLLIDGIQRDFWTIDPARLRRLLAARN